MSYSSLAKQVVDGGLADRITASAEKEGWQNPDLSGTDYGLAIQHGLVSPIQQFGWPVCIATEAPYEFALNSGNPSPGTDPAVITDADILAAVQHVWPTEWPPTSPPAVP
jgi:hypothetical protein